MTRRKIQFTVGEWYHCHNGGIEKRTLFEDIKDYHRFLELLYLANDRQPLRRGDIEPGKFEEIFKIRRGEKLVVLGAFCLMPDHFHLAVKEVASGGITAFMRKIGTAYTMYFNARHGRRGNLFLGPFQSLQVPANHLQHLISYVHTDPAALYEPEWKTSHVVDPQFLGEQVVAYPYSSLGATGGGRAPISAILDAEALPVATARTQKMLQEARQYYADFLDV